MNERALSWDGYTGDKLDTDNRETLIRRLRKWKSVCHKIA
jgi:hypothetical protein